MDPVPASPPPGSCKAPALTRPTWCALAKQQCSLGGNRACRNRLSRPEAYFPSALVPTERTAVGVEQESGRVLHTNSGFPFMVSIPRSSLSLGEPLATLLFRPVFASCSL